MVSKQIKSVRCDDVLKAFISSIAKKKHYLQ